MILVAPWLDPEKELSTGFFDFKIDEDLVSRTKDLVVIWSADDDEVILQTVDILKKNLKLKNTIWRQFHDKGHFCLEDLGTDEFPELLDEALKIENYS